jgi:hypothetical protein
LGLPDLIMNRQQIRGKWIFLFLATLLILEKLAGVGFVFSGDWGQIKWFGSVVKPLLIAAGIAFLWTGENWSRWLLSTAYILSGGFGLYLTGRIWFALSDRTPPDDRAFLIDIFGLPMGIVAAFATFHLVAGLAFLTLPSLRAFFRYQRTPRVWIESV